METSARGIQLIKSFEGFRSHAYQDQAGVWTIGYGTTLGVQPGQFVDEPTAHNMLMWEVKKIEHFMKKVVKVSLNQNQYDALVCFIYNVGHGAFFSSTLLKRINLFDMKGAADQLLRWNKIRVNGKVIVSKGLTNRRKLERELFIEPILLH